MTKSSRNGRGIFTKISLGVLATLGITTLTSIPAAADSGLELEMHDIPDRGYYLAGDYVHYTFACGEGSDLKLDDPDLFYEAGSAGASPFNMSLGFGNPSGSHAIKLTCTDSDTGEKETKTITFEVRESLELVATVGTVSGECAATTEITVAAGTEVYWCYTLRAVPELEIDRDITDFWSLHEISDAIGGAAIPPFTTSGLGNDRIILSTDHNVERASIVDEDITNHVAWTVSEFDSDEEASEENLNWDYSLTATAVALVAADAPVVEPEPDVNGQGPEAEDPAVLVPQKPQTLGPIIETPEPTVHPQTADGERPVAVRAQPRTAG